MRRVISNVTKLHIDKWDHFVFQETWDSNKTYRSLAIHSNDRWLSLCLLVYKEIKRTMRTIKETKVADT